MRYYLLLILVLLAGQSSAQQSATPDKTKFGIIIGNLVEATKGKSIPLARIDLYKTATDSLLYSTITDKNGAFEFNHLGFGYFTLRARAMGFANTQIDSIFLRADRYDFNIGDVKLKEESNVLNEVIVYSEKPLIEVKDDKLTYNVGESALSNGSSTAEILKNIPLINNDPTGKILLKGKEPKILIDDKPTDLTPQQLQDLLESLPGSSIEKIEVMTNPPPQYATETGGVINIVTKKGKIGWVGRVNISAGTRGEGNFSGNLSYRNKKLSINQTIGTGVSQISGNSYSTRTNIYTDSTNYFKTTGRFTNKNTRPNWRTQIDYEMNKNNQFGFVYQGNLNYFDNLSNNSYTNFNRFNEVYKVSTRENQSVGDGYTHSVTFSYTHKGKNLAEVLRIFVIGNTSKNDNDRDFFQQFLNPVLIPTGVDSTQTQYFNNSNRSLTSRLEYTKPLKMKGSSFSGGFNYLVSDFHNTLNTAFLRKSDGVYVPNDLLSNDFLFKQNIFTIRAGLSFLFKENIRLTFGAQAEQTIMGFNFIKANVSDVSNNYWNILPNLTLRKEFDKTLNTSLVYRATIRRPGIGELNPNVDYSDPYNLRFGNPYLVPTLSHNFDWNLSWVKGKYYINTSIGFNKVDNVFNTIRNLIEGGKTVVTYLNIAARKEYEASVFGGYTFNKQFRMNASAGFTYNMYSEKEKQIYLYQDGGTFYSSLNYTYTPTNVWNIEGSTRFNSFADPQGRSRSNLSLNLGVQRKFFDRRLIIGLNVIDPFTPQQYITVTTGKQFNIESVNATTTRNYRLSISYQLNKLVQKSTLSDKQKKEILDKLKR
ncbi:MAG: outer membrane beta-barrel protein [Sphingobacteriia bacterium]|jgi:hypothetical protein